jgi:hypothetical protein
MRDDILKFALPERYPVDGCDSSGEEDEEDTILEEIYESLAESLGAEGMVMKMPVFVK